MTFLHGIETIEMPYGIRPISLIDSSTIGIVGTAPGAAGATAARLTLGTLSAATLMTVTADAAGPAGNAITLALVDPGVANGALTVSLTGSAVSVALATDATKAITTTAAQLVAAINAHAGAGALVTAALSGGHAGGGVVRPLAARALAGGAAEPFPVNVPVLIAGSRTEAAGLGTTGTLPAAIAAVFAQGVGARIVVIRVAEGANAAATLANVIGGVDGSGNNTGMQALLDARAATGVRPGILIAPGFSQNAAAASGLSALAGRIRAVALIDGPNTTDAAAITFRGQFGSDRVMVIDPWVKVFDTATATEIDAPPSAYAAGVVVRTDQAWGGPWKSPSNELIEGILGTARPVSFAYNDPACRANILNENEVSTIVSRDGWRLWGNRSTSGDQLWAFLSVRRTADLIEESIEAAHLWAIDRPFSTQLLKDILDGVNDFLRTMKARGAILGGRAWIDPEINTETTLKAGQLFVDYDFEPAAPLERLTFRASRNGDYYTDLVQSVAATSAS